MSKRLRHKLWRGTQISKASVFKDLADEYKALDRTSNEFRELQELGMLGTRIHKDSGNAFGPRPSAYQPHDSTLALAVAHCPHDESLQLVPSTPKDKIRCETLKLRREARAAAKRISEREARLDLDLAKWSDKERATPPFAMFPWGIPEPGALPSAEVAISPLELSSEFFAAASTSQVAALREDIACDAPFCKRSWALGTKRTHNSHSLGNVQCSCSVCSSLRPLCQKFPPHILYEISQVVSKSEGTTGYNFFELAQSTCCRCVASVGLAKHFECYPSVLRHSHREIKCFTEIAEPRKHTLSA
jgi:hypothetical protein